MDFKKRKKIKIDANFDILQSQILINDLLKKKKKKSNSQNNLYFGLSTLIQVPATSPFRCPLGKHLERVLYWILLSTQVRAFVDFSWGFLCWKAYETSPAQTRQTSMRITRACRAAQRHANHAKVNSQCRESPLPSHWAGRNHRRMIRIPFAYFLVDLLRRLIIA